MKTNLLKNFFLIGSGIAIATSTAIFANNQQGTSIQANLVNLVQYLGELHITSDGTPNGTMVLNINGSGEFQQIRGNASLINSSDNYFGLDGFIGSIQENTGGYTYMHGIVGTEDPANFLGIVLNGSLKDYIGVQSGGITMTATPSGSDTGYDLDLTSDGIFARGIDQGTNNNMTRQDATKSSYIMRLLNDGTLKLKNYIFPLADGSAGQVLSSQGNGQLVWADATGGATDSIQSIKISISSVELLTLNTSPVELVPAPGVGKFIDVISLVAKKNFNTTQYGTNTNAQPIYEGTFNTIANSIDLSFSSSALDKRGITGGDIQENKAIVLTEFGGNPQNGDGTLDIYITYRIVTL